MTGFLAFLSKEFLEIRRTWRIWVLPGMIVFFAVASPIVALVTPALVASIAGSQPGVVIQLPDPVALDAHQQFLKNLSQIVLIAVLIAGAGAVSGERRAGTAVLVLTKPVSRQGFVLAKVISLQALLVAATAIGTVVCMVMTFALFGSSPIGSLVAGVSLWLVLALMMVALMALLSVLFSSTGAATGVGLGFYFVMAVLSSWSPAAEYSFVGLGSLAAAALAGRPTQVGWPVATAVVAGLALGATAVWSFRRLEL
ncbi:MAG: ABC transporter permease [Planctomycetota bacterium]|jgi:ABC-2 type transport system permease protein